MIRSRGALATVLVVSAWRTVGADPCAPRALLEGDAEAITRVAAELARLGVSTDATDAAGAPRAPATAPTAPTAGGCRTISAAVELDRSGGIAVAVRDASHRSEGRVVSDAALAAAWIDSWLRDDFEAPIAPPSSVPVAPAPGLVPAQTTATPATDTSVATTDRASWLDRGSLAATYDSAWTDGGASWSGFDISACARIGALCVGGRVRDLAGDEIDQLTSAHRSDVSALATASWSHDVGQLAIAPELGVGVGRLATERVDGCEPPPPCDPTTGPCPPPPPKCTSGQSTNAIYVGDGFHVATYTPRVEAALRVAVPLFAHVYLDGIASVTLAPFGHGGAYVPMSSPPGVPPDQIALPGDPVATYVLGLGLRVGAR